MTRNRFFFAALFFGLFSRQPTLCAALHFEPWQGGFNVEGGRFASRIEPTQLLIGSADGNFTVLHWERAATPILSGEHETGGRTNYYLTADPSTWKLDIPHFDAVSAHGLYPGIDVLFHHSGSNLEFDAVVEPGSDPRVLNFTLSTHGSLTASGDLQIDSSGFTLKKPVAWQIVNGARQPVECAFRLETSGRIWFEPGLYDPSLSLTIDPVVEFATYLGGNGIDTLQSLAADSAGNALAAGVSTSTNFPGASFGRQVTFTYVTKLSPEGSSTLYTTVLGSGNNTPNAGGFESVPGLAVDNDDSVFVSGTTFHTANFPVTAGSWNTANTNSYAGYAAHLDSSGHVIYATFLGNSGWSPSPVRVRVRNGIPYIAGNVSSAAFYGTAGAFQRNLNGTSDFVVIALAADGTAPLFVTALGGSGTEYLYDMNLDAAGNILLRGQSSSTDFPLAPGAFNLTSAGGVIARLKSDGSALLDSTSLGVADIASIAPSADGTHILVIGQSSLPASLTGQGMHNTINLPENTANGYLAELSLSPMGVVWTTGLPVVYPSGQSLQTDSAGHIYYADSRSWLGGGAPQYAASLGINKVAPDGASVEWIAGYSGGLLAVRPSGEVLAGGTVYGGLQTTSGVVQPVAPAKTNVNFQTPPTLGFLTRYNTSALTGNNFFVRPPSGALAITWRIGEPAPSAATLPLSFSTAPFPLTFSATNSALSASPSPDNSTLNIGFTPSTSLTAGKTTESITIASGAAPLKSLNIPVTLTVQPQVSIALDTSQVTIELRQGQTYTPVKVGITENFGTEYFSLTTSSSQPWLYSYADQDAPNHQQLTISVQALSPGTYDGTITVGIQGLHSGSQVLQVHYVIDPPATIQLSATTLNLHIVKGQPVTPVSTNVTSAVSGVKFSLFVGMYPSFLQFKTIGTTTPGSIQFTADSSAAVTGYYSANFTVSGESGPGIVGTIFIDVSSGAPVDVAPSSINYTFFRNGQYGFQSQYLDVTAPSATPVTWTADQLWISPGSGTLTTPSTLYVNFNNTLPEGVYKANIILTAGATKITVPVVFNLYDTPHLVFPTAPFTFNYQIGGPLPPPQTLQVTSPTVTPGTFAAGAENYPGFLTVSPSTNATPATLTVSVNPSGLAPGTYSNYFDIEPSYGTSSSNGYTRIPVTLNVTPNPNASPATISSISDASSYVGGAVAPGEIMVLFGSQLSPSGLTIAQPDSTNTFPSLLAGTSVNFDNIPAPLIYVSSGQVAAVAPFEIAGKTKTVVTVSTGGALSSPVTLSVAPTNPNIFTANSSGSGQVAALLYPAGGAAPVLNGTANPAAAGDAIAFYVSGLGATNPVIPDGSIVTTPLPVLAASGAKVLLGGQLAQILYAGPAPGLIAGMSQINVRIPSGIPAGDAQLLVTVDGNTSQPGVTLAVH